MAAQALLNLPNEIMCKIIEIVGEDSFYYLGGFLRAGKRGYSLVHEPSILKKCDVTPMVTFATCQIGNGGQFREFLLKFVNAGNITAIYYEGLHAASIIGLEESIKILEPNVPPWIINLSCGNIQVCLGKDKEASKVFQQFAAYHHDLRSDAMLEKGDDLEWLLLSFGAPYMNRYSAAFKFLDDEVIK